MKPVPFAQYLERQQKAPSGEPSEPLAWPKRGAKPDAAEAPRNSPLLRRVEAERAEARAQAAQRSEHAAQRSEHGPQRLEQSRLLAFEEGRESARRELEDERAKIREAVEAEVARARTKWLAEQGDILAAAHRAAFDSFETRCAQAVANILRPFATHLLIGRVTEALVENLEVLFAGASHASFEISGPAELLDALREKFASRDIAVLYRPNERIDVRVAAGDTIIETQLGAWMRALGALPREVAEPEGQELGREMAHE
jgi:hypothetical protein